MIRNRRHVANDDLVTYRGRPNRALYIGQTKFGPRAHLEFLDGSRDFWVDADLVTDPRDENEDTDHGAAGRAAASEEFTITVTGATVNRTPAAEPRDPGEDAEDRFNDQSRQEEREAQAWEETYDPYGYGQ